MNNKLKSIISTFVVMDLGFISIRNYSESQKIKLKDTASLKYKNIKNENHLFYNEYSFSCVDNENLLTKKEYGITWRPLIIRHKPLESKTENYYY